MTNRPTPFPSGELCALIGPTAAGKTELSTLVAERAGAEIVSLDSMQVYTGMDIGTAKPTLEERAGIPHHMLDLVTPDVRYDVQRFLRDLQPILESIEARGKRALFVGGTAFYLKVLTHGLFDGPEVDPALRARLEGELVEVGAQAFHDKLAAVDPASAERLHPNDGRRVVRALEVLEQTGRTLSDWQREWREESGERSAGTDRRLVGVGHAVPDLDSRILKRSKLMLDAGWPEEAKRVRDTTGFGETSVQALGYSQVLRLVDGELNRADCASEIALRTRQFARKQRTWYRKFEEIQWLEGVVEQDQERMVLAALEAFGWA
jgi:tRNA dimethylallyltransferase